MTSGELITYFIPGTLIIFITWELIQLERKRGGNKSARTNSQWVIWKAKGGSVFWRRYLIIFPIFITLVGLWLLFHWEGLCINWEVLCWIDI